KFESQRGQQRDSQQDEWQRALRMYSLQVAEEMASGIDEPDNERNSENQYADSARLRGLSIKYACSRCCCHYPSLPGAELFKRLPHRLSGTGQAPLCAPKRVSLGPTFRA